MKPKNKLEKNDPRFIWVAPQECSGGDGSYGNPYDSITMAMELAHPGQIVVLKAGRYIGDVTIQKGGTIDKPVRIVAEEGADVQCIASCWFFYDVSDVICSGIVFKDSPGMALSIVGKCMRNRFEFLRFINCSLEKESACTFFFGGSGQACNTVESCFFERTPEAMSGARPHKGASVGLMIAEGDLLEGDANRDLIISKNVFSRYDYGLIVGSSDSTDGEYGHHVVYNTFDNCASEGIMVKCGDTLVKGNVVRNCGHHSISIPAGTGSIVEDNRIVDCGWGIRVAGKGHSISNNCIVRCSEASLGVLSSNSPEMACAINILIEGNTFVGGNPVRAKNCGIRIEPMTTCIVRKNLFHDTVAPYEITGSKVAHGHKAGHLPSPDKKNFLISDNIVSGACAPLGGCVPAKVVFLSAALDNYVNDSGYGAFGWMLSPEAYDPGPNVFCEPPAADADEGREENREAVESDDEPAETIEVEENEDCEGGEELAVRSFFFDIDDEDGEKASAHSTQESEDCADDEDGQEG